MKAIKALQRQAQRTLARIHQNETGAMSIEKVLLILVIVIPIVLVLIIFRDKLLGFFEEDSDSVLDQKDYGG